MADEPLLPPLPDPQDVLRWINAMLHELAQAPETLRRARLVFEALTELPVQIERMTDSLDRTVGFLERSIGQISNTLGGGMNESLEHLDKVVSDLRDTMSALIGAIPGARRALQTVARPPRDA